MIFLSTTNLRILSSGGASGIEQFPFCRMLIRKRSHYFSGGSSGLDSAGRFDKRFIVLFKLLFSDGQQFIERRLDHLFVAQLLNK